MIFAAIAVAVAIPVGMGVLILARSTHRRVGWLLVAHGVCVGLLLTPGELPGALPWARTAERLTQGAWVFLFLWLVLIAYLLPDGKAASRFWRVWIRSGLAGVVLFNIGAIGSAEGLPEGSLVPWLAPEVFDVLGIVGLLLMVGLFFGSAVAVGYRLRRASGEARLPLLWLVWGALSVPVALLILWANYFGLGDRDWLTYVGLVLASVALPLTIGAAILKHRLFDIRLVLSRSLTYGTLTLLVLAVYALGLAATDRVFGGNAVGGVLAVVIVAVAIHPTATFLRRRIERWVYGYRSAPYEALRLLADRAESAEPDRAAGRRPGDEPRARRCRDGPADARPRRHRSDPPTHPRRQPASRHRADDVRGRRLGVRGDAGRRQRLPAQGRRTGPDRAGQSSRGGRRGDLRPGDSQARDHPLRLGRRISTRRRSRR